VRGAPISPIGFHRLIQRLGEAANMPFPIHPHMLRHACGFKLTNDGHDTRALQHYLRHKNIQHTVRYTEMAPDRFKITRPLAMAHASSACAPPARPRYRRARAAGLDACAGFQAQGSAMQQVPQSLQ